ncbi:hypothetical protein EG329_003614 [Mollisiaceae sp. DMI_Dod_QoI]|nr:hypothetical protein EG329_003614 [Helotiales sp. DMI_Dod_QoI]
MATSDSKAQFLYQPLDVEPPTIRLLKNIRVDESGLIAMNIEHIPLKSQPQYTALSWVWGRDKSFTKIHLGASSFYVSNQLYYILEWICKNPRVSTYWWIDSICLNQADLEEKNSQVKLMERIYREAEKTIGWFGKGSENIAVGSQVDMTTSQGEEAIRFIYVIIKERDQLEDPTYRKAFLLKHSDPRPWKAIERFFQRPWWARVWTLQEFIMPREFVFCCGQESIGRADMNSGTYCVHLFDKDDHVPVKLEVYLPAWNRRRLYNWHRIAGSRFQFDQEIRPSEMSLPALIAYGSDSKATMAEDRIYSLLGLAQCKLVTPDYKLGIGKSYTELVRAFVTFYRSLDIICFCHVFNQRERISIIYPILPSWVPDWRVHRESYIMPVMASQSGVTSIGNFRPHSERKLRPDKTIYAAGGEKPPCVRFSDDLLTLTCNGILLGRIDGIGGIKIKRRVWEENRGDFNIPEILDYVQSTSPVNIGGGLKISGAIQSNNCLINDISRSLVLDRKDRYLTYPAPSHFCRSFARACKAAQETPKTMSPRIREWFDLNMCLSVRGCTLQDRCCETEGCLCAAESLEDQSVDLARDAQFWNRVHETVTHMERRLVTTDEGSIGMAPYRVQKGDIVCVLVGCNIPMAIRQRGTGYEVIGECYLHGFMGGEALRLLEAGKLKLEDYNLV